jgi:hypothetical protein
MSQANVTAGAFSNAVWYTDKAEIVTGSNSVTYNVYAVALPPYTYTTTVNTTNGSNIATTAGTIAVPVGAAISGTGIAGGSTVTAYTPGVSITLSANATANGTAITATVTPAPVGNLYSANPQIAANSKQQIYVGAGNKLTIIGGNSTARELGTASSATAGVNALNP